MAGRRVGAVDAMWLRADRPENLMVVDALLWTARPVTLEAVRDLVRDRLLVHPVLTERAVDPGGLRSPRWVADPAFDLRRHVVAEPLPAPAGDTELRHLVERRMSVPLPRDRPLWELRVVPEHDGGSAVLFRAHHAVADGLALAQVLVELTDPPPEPPRPVAEPPVPSGRRRRDAPAGTIEQLRSLPRLALGTARVADKLLLGHDPVSQLSGPPHPERRAAWSAPVPLDDVRAVAHAVGATVNDVLLCCVAGAVSRLLSAGGEPVADLTTMVPVDVRPPGPLPLELGNRFALVLLRLPTSQPDDLARLLATKDRMDRIKASPEAALTFGLIRGIGRLHPRLGRLVVDFFAGKAFGVTTDVIGPREPRLLAGERLSGVMGWVPGSGSHTVGASVVSYAGEVRVGFRTDAATVPDPTVLVRGVQACLVELQRRTR